MIHLGLIDIFNLLGVMSKRLQKVEVFPWQIVDIQEDMIAALKKMADIKLTNEAGDIIENELDKNLWPALENNIENVLKGEYKGQETTVFHQFRRG